MSDLLLNAETGRTEGTRPSRRLRREGKIPAVVYGLDADPVAISVDWPDLRRCLTTDAGRFQRVGMEERVDTEPVQLRVDR